MAEMIARSTKTKVSKSVLFHHVLAYQFIEWGQLEYFTCLWTFLVKPFLFWEFIGAFRTECFIESISRCMKNELVFKVLIRILFLHHFWVLFFETSLNYVSIHRCSLKFMNKYGFLVPCLIFTTWSALRHLRSIHSPIFDVFMLLRIEI